MPLVSEFNPQKIKQLHHDLSEVLSRVLDSLEMLEKATLKFKNSISDRTSVEAIKIVNEYKKIIKKMQETANESIESVKSAADKFAYIEDVLASRLR